MAEIPEGTVTILFSDVEGSTELRTQRGDTTAHDILRAHETLFRQQVEKHRGVEVKALGDGFMVVFPSVRRAVSCAVDIQRVFAKERRHRPDQTVKVRIGLNTGEVVREDGDLYGEAVNAAARIMDRAKGGEILVSDIVKALAGTVPDVEFTERGPVELKGFPSPWNLFEVSWREEAPVGIRLLEQTPFIGRETERGELRRLLEEADAGRGALALVGGEPGVGKTRLSEEISAEARTRGMIALAGHCSETESAPPYVAIIEILEEAARLIPPETYRELLGDGAGEVARIVPQIRRTLPDVPEPLELPAEQERRYLFNSITEFLERAGRRRPLVLLIDDLHWADGSTLLLLRHVAERIAEMPVLILGTYRDIELDTVRPLADALEGLLSRRLAHSLILKSLPEDGVRAILGALSGREPPPAIVQAIYEETDGNPFFVEEVFKHLFEEGLLLDAEGDWRTGIALEELQVPKSVRLVVGRRLERLGEAGIKALTAAAVIGRNFSYGLLQSLEEVGEDDLLDAMDEAERASLLVLTDPGRVPRYRFAHELIRQTLLEGLSLPRRQRIHFRVAEAMERLYMSELEEHAADLAYHLYQAGAAADPGKTARYLCLAGFRALEASAFENALRYLEDARSLLPEDDTKSRADLLRQLGLTYRSLGRWDDAIETWKEALDLFERVGEKETAGRVAWDAAFQLGWAARWVESFEMTSRGLAALEDYPSNPDRARLTAAAGYEFGAAGYREAADQLLEEGVALAEKLNNRSVLGQCLQSKTLHHWTYLEPQLVIETGRRSAELLRESGELWNLGQLLSFVTVSMSASGRWDEVVPVQEETEEIVTRLGDHAGQLVLLRSSATRAFYETGDLDLFERFVNQDVELCLTANMPWIGQAYTWLGLLEYWRGKWDAVLPHIRAAAEIETFPAYTGWEQGALILYTALLGDSAEALQLYERIEGELPQTGRPNTSGSWHLLAYGIEALDALGERERAANLYPLALELVATGTLYLFNYRLVETTAGIAAAAGERWEDAERHFEAALRLTDEIPAKIEQPEVCRFYARMLLQRDGPGDREKAKQRLSEAIDSYKVIGMPKHVEMAEELLGNL